MGALLALALVSWGGCGNGDGGGDGVDEVRGEPPVEARVRPPPIAGGTVFVTADDQIVAADPDRDVVFIADLGSRSLSHEVALEPGDRPGRGTSGDDGRVHIALTGAGALASIDIETGMVVRRTEVCPEPRGVAYDPEAGLVYVACISGVLAHVDEASGEVVDREFRGPDLRDVVVVDGEPLVSTFRRAALIDSAGGQRLPITTPERLARVAWRTRLDPAGNVVMLHQAPGTEDVPLEPRPPEVTESTDPYGGGGGCRPGIGTVAVSIFSDGGIETDLLPLARLTVDAAISPGGGVIAFAMPGAPEGESTAVFAEPGKRCELVDGPDDHQVTAVAWSDSGTLVMQSREPAALLVQINVPTADVEVIELPGQSRYDTAHELFHRTTRSGLSCASCHPEAGDDGHVWSFAGLGPRRTQPLNVGLDSDGPLHWDGDLDGLVALLDEVMVRRMGGAQRPTSHADSLARWLDDNARPAVAAEEDPALVRAGEDAFGAHRCTDCHGMDGDPVVAMSEIRGQTIKTPSLRRVSLRAPYMREGWAPDLEAAVADMIESTTDGSSDPETVAAIAAFLRTL